MNTGHCCFQQCRINRNIVECKGGKITISTWQKSVLIETLWNVKISVRLLIVYLILVLIETLWNVKSGHLSLRQQQVPY